MPNTETIDYLLKGMPRPLWEKAQAKAAAHEPPISMKWVLRQLLERWVETPTGAKPPERPKKIPSARKPTAKMAKKPERYSQQTPQPSTPTTPKDASVPDLGDSF